MGRSSICRAQHWAWPPATIWLDANSAGWGWFVDQTPRSDSEFTTPGKQGEQGRMDLLCVLMHEMDHVFGLNHYAEGVMQESLAPGTRLQPTAGAAGTAATPGAALTAVFAGIPTDAGEVPPPGVGLRDHDFAAPADWDALAVAISQTLEARRQG
jgi:hypothetical protein